MLDFLFTQSFWQNTYWQNTLQSYVEAAIILIMLIIIFKAIKSVALVRLHKLAKRTKTDVDDMLVDVFATVKPPFYAFIALYIAIRTLTFPDIVQQVVNAILIIWAVFVAIKAVQIFIDFIFKKKTEGEDERTTVAALGAVRIISKIVLWTFGLLLILSNMGVNINSLIAGLGIGGIAVALALQNILGDLFSSFAIYFDKPFVVGDFVVVGKHLGTVEKIGIKTTRIRALQGEEIVISNKELTSTRIQNFKKMEKRRIVFGFGVTYGTPNDKLKQIPSIVTDIIKQQENAYPDRVHFKEFADSSLNYEVVYFVESSDYNQYMDIQQHINLNIKEKLEQAGVSMAFPTRTVHLEK